MAGESLPRRSRGSVARPNHLLSLTNIPRQIVPGIAHGLRILSDSTTKYEWCVKKSFPRLNSTIAGDSWDGCDSGNWDECGVGEAGSRFEREVARQVVMARRAAGF